MLNKDPYFFSEQPLFILIRKEYIYIANNSKYTKHTIDMAIIIHFVGNGEDYILQNTMWCEVGLQLADIGTSNVRED